MNARGKPKATVLVIDDEQIVHESVQRILEDEGYQVAGALRVDRALEMLSETAFDLVLTDLMMPDRNGMEVVEAVARDHPATGVVMFTGFATVDSAVQSMKLGAFDYLPKPFTPEELVEVVAKSLEKTWKGRRDREIEATYSEAERALRASLDLQEILKLICSSVCRLLKVKGSSVLMYRKKEQTLEVVSSSGLSEEYLRKGVIESEKSIPQGLEARKPLIVEDSEFQTRLNYPEQARKEGIVAIVSLPLQVRDAILGFLRIYSADKRSFTDDEMDLLVKFAEQSARAMENAMQYERVRSDIEGMKKSIPGTIARKMQEQG